MLNAEDTMTDAQAEFNRVAADRARVQEVLYAFGRSGVTAAEAAAGIKQFMAAFGVKLPARPAEPQREGR